MLIKEVEGGEIAHLVKCLPCILVRFSRGTELIECAHLCMRESMKGDSFRLAFRMWPRLSNCAVSYVLRNILCSQA